MNIFIFNDLNNRLVIVFSLQILFVHNLTICVCNGL